jgi:hypothetical protein
MGFVYSYTNSFCRKEFAGFLKRRFTEINCEWFAKQVLLLDTHLLIQYFDPVYLCFSCFLHRN